MTDTPLTVELLVEEPSAESALDALVPKIIPGVAFAVRVIPGKDRLLRELPKRLAGYAARLAWENLRVVVLVDRDDQDCHELKRDLEQVAKVARVATPVTAVGRPILLNRIVVEELEAWFFGDVPALCTAYPRLPVSLGKQVKYRDPDAIRGGTWEALEDVLQKHGYHSAGLRKRELAAAVAPHMDVETNRSTSFQVFRDGLRRLVSEGSHAEED